MTEKRDPDLGKPDYLKRQLQEMAPHRALLRSIESRYMASEPFVHPVLDVGSGDGHFAQVTFDEPIDVGLDPTRKTMLEAQARGSSVYKYLVEGSATKMPFPDGAFNTVISNSVLEHIPDIDGALAEINRVMASGATFAMTTPSDKYPDYLMGASVCRKLHSRRLAKAYGDLFNRISFHYHVDSPEVWKARFASLGWEVDEYVTYFSPAAHRSFDLSHYVGVPTLINKKLRGSWMIHARQADLLDRWFRRYYDEALPETGAYQYFRCTKP